ncbi:hypothetical protein [Armatimonas sp.]|uniref:hypothetical protein n=1 Tax=Armatimonas sp. TaxID=1872638 RepID=UPI0037537709
MGQKNRGRHGRNYCQGSRIYPGSEWFLVLAYLRIIYGPEYTDPQHLSRLRERGLTGKRSLALREFALGIEGLERFVRKEPPRQVHEFVFATLALESEPVDPRL